jgi:hypothetical protein
LICSYPECVAQGVKFCFCIYCGIPVAKRNFRQRHNHGQKKGRQNVHPHELASNIGTTTNTTTTTNSDSANLKEEFDDQGPAQGTTHSSVQGVHQPFDRELYKQPEGETPASPSVKPTSRIKAPAEDDDEGEESFSTGSSSTSSMNQGRITFRNVHKAQYRDNATSGGSGRGEKRSNIIRTQQGGKVWTPANVSEERKERWASLLYDRPEERNEDDMSHWLLSVLQVSDPATSVPSMSSSNGANESGGGANTGSGSTNTANNGSSSNLGSSTSTSRGPGDGSGDGSGDTGSRGSREQSSSPSHTSDEDPSNVNVRRKSSIMDELTPHSNQPKTRQPESPDQTA